MRSRKDLTMIVVVLVILGLAQNSKTTSRVAPGPPPEQSFYGSAARISTTTSRSFVDFPTPGHTFTTKYSRNIVVEFFTSARLTVAGEFLELRAVVDGTPVNPGPMRYTGTDLRSVSYSGFLSGVPPGTHTVTMQWRVTGGAAIMENRTFIIWVNGEGASY